MADKTKKFSFFDKLKDIFNPDLTKLGSSKKSTIPSKKVVEDNKLETSPQQTSKTETESPGKNFKRSNIPSKEVERNKTIEVSSHRAGKITPGFSEEGVSKFNKLIEEQLAMEPENRSSRKVIAEPDIKSQNTKSGIPPESHQETMNSNNKLQDHKETRQERLHRMDIELPSVKLAKLRKAEVAKTPSPEIRSSPDNGLQEIVYSSSGPQKPEITEEGIKLQNAKRSNPREPAHRKSDEYESSKEPQNNSKLVSADSKRSSFPDGIPTRGFHLNNRSSIDSRISSADVSKMQEELSKKSDLAAQGPVRSISGQSPIRSPEHAPQKSDNTDKIETSPTNKVESHKGEDIIKRDIVAKVESIKNALSQQSQGIKNGSNHALPYDSKVHGRER